MMELGEGPVELRECLVGGVGAFDDLSVGKLQLKVVCLFVKKTVSFDGRSRCE